VKLQIKTIGVRLPSNVFIGDRGGDSMSSGIKSKQEVLMFGGKEGAHCRLSWSKGYLWQTSTHRRGHLGEWHWTQQLRFGQQVHRWDMSWGYFKYITLTTAFIHFEGSVTTFFSQFFIAWEIKCIKP